MAAATHLRVGPPDPDGAAESPRERLCFDLRSPLAIPRHHVDVGLVPVVVSCDKRHVPEGIRLRGPGRRWMVCAERKRTVRSGQVRSGRADKRGKGWPYVRTVGKQISRFVLFIDTVP